MIVTVFRSRLDPEHAGEYQSMLQRMRDIAQDMPGFVASKTFTAEDGERVTLVYFDTRDNLDAWARHPLHREAQQAGRERFYTNTAFRCAKACTSMLSKNH